MNSSRPPTSRNCSNASWPTIACLTLSRFTSRIYPPVVEDVWIGDGKRAGDAVEHVHGGGYPRQSNPRASRGNLLRLLGLPVISPGGKDGRDGPVTHP